MRELWQRFALKCRTFFALEISFRKWNIWLVKRMNGWASGEVQVANKKRNSMTARPILLFGRRYVTAEQKLIKGSAGLRLHNSSTTFTSKECIWIILPALKGNYSNFFSSSTLVKVEEFFKKKINSLSLAPFIAISCEKQQLLNEMSAVFLSFNRQLKVESSFSLRSWGADPANSKLPPLMSP